MWGVAVDSEKMMKEAKLLIGDNLKAGWHPSPLSTGMVVSLSSMVYIPNLWMKIKDQMDQNSDEERQ